MNRFVPRIRPALRQICFLFVLFTGLIAGLLSPEKVSAAEEKQNPPNMLIIYLDDFGWRDTAFMGSDFYETPNLDKLAADGMTFSDAYAGAANCAPSRACLLSGQYAPRHEIYNVGTGPRGKSEYRKIKHIPGTDTLRDDIVTWAECLHAAGYRTASIGKWHLSKSPTDHGFDVNIGGSHSGSPPKGYFPPHNVEGLKDAPRGEYLTDRLTDESIRFVERNASKPWCLYLTHFAVHTPLQARKETVEKYLGKTKGELHQHEVMAAMIESVDQGVGRLLKRIDELNLTNRTVVIFTSDNGGYGPATSMKPLKGYKGTYYEGGIRVPLVVKWPGVVAAGSKCDVPVTTVDYFPTMLEIAGVEPPEQTLDGVSIVPLLRSESELARDAIYWHFPAYLQSYARTDQQRDPLFRSRPCSVIRSGDWKLLEYFEDDAIELFNLQEDIGESENLAETLPAKREELRNKLKSWQKYSSAPLPAKPNPEYDEEAHQKALQKARTKKR